MQNPKSPGTYYVKYEVENYSVRSRSSNTIPPETAYWTGQEWLTFNPKDCIEFEEILKTGFVEINGKEVPYPRFHRPVYSFGIIAWREIETNAQGEPQTIIHSKINSHERATPNYRNNTV